MSLKNVFYAFVIGAAAGATIALLNTPRTGDEMRDMLRESSEDAKVQAQRLVDEVSATTQKKSARLKDIGQEVVNEQKSSLERGIAEARETIRS